MTYVLGPNTCWSYGCVKCQTRHYEYEPIFEEHKYHESKHGHQIVPLPVDKHAGSCSMCHRKHRDHSPEQARECLARFGVSDERSSDYQSVENKPERGR